jgi:hypothetical protein
VTQQEIAKAKAQDETLFRYLETEQNLKKRGISERRSVFFYLREHGIKKYKNVEPLVKDMKKADLDPFEYAEKRAKVEVLWRSKAGEPPQGEAKPPPPEVFVRINPDTSMHTEPLRVRTEMLNRFIQWRIERKKAKEQARTKKAREKSSANLA